MTESPQHSSKDGSEYSLTLYSIFFTTVFGHNQPYKVVFNHHNIDV